MSAPRWIVSGRLSVVSPLSIRTGREQDADPAPQREKESWRVEPNVPPESSGNDGEVPPIMGIELDHNMMPFIPASALKGLIRNRAAAALPEDLEQNLLRLLGDQVKEGRSGDKQAKVAQGGSAEILNCYCVHNPNLDFRPPVRGRTALHEGSRTAEDGQLRQDRMVPPDTAFGVTITLCRAEEADVSLLVGILKLINGCDASSALGSGSSQGDGRVSFKLDSVKRFGPEQARNYLAAPPEKRWEELAVTIPHAEMTITPKPDCRITLAFTLPIEGHFLVAAKEMVPSKSEADKGKFVAHTRPFRMHGGDNKTARLPGSSLDGALRAQAKRIFRTLADDFGRWEDNDTELPGSLASLFGSAKAGSLLECEEFNDGSAKLVTQEFVAIDRLSGGSADDKKFDQTAFERPNLSGKLHLVLNRKTQVHLTGKSGMTESIAMTPEAIGLFALTIKDLANGDIPLGHSTRKGYGGVGGLIFGNGGWMELLEAVGEQVLPHIGTVTSLDPLKDCRTARDVIEKAVGLLHVEAAEWKAIRLTKHGAEA